METVKARQVLGRVGLSRLRGQWVCEAVEGRSVT